jgi:xylulokinase
MAWFTTTLTTIQDHECAGVGAVEDGDLVVSLGTSGTLFCPSAKPILDVKGRIAPFCDATGVLPSLTCV